MVDRKKKKEKESKNKTILLVLFLLASVLFFMEIGEHSEGKGALIVGYCPTMEEYAISLYGDNSRLRQFRNSAEVLSSLRKKDIDVALTGRPARYYEIGDHIKEEMIESGYTLVTSERKDITKDMLNELTIHTHKNRKFAEGFIPEADFEFHDDISSSLKLQSDDAALISWNEYEDDMQLLVVHDGHLKDERFRTPFIYER